MKKIVLIPILALGLMACQANTTEDPEKEEVEETEETKEVKEVKEVKENNPLKKVFEKVDLALYDEIIDNYATFTEMSQEEAENASLEGVKSGAYDYFYSGDIFEGISVTYYDLNDDGVEELLIALRSGPGGYALIDLFTIVDGEVISLFTDEMSKSAMYKRSGFSLLENGNLVYTTASGAGEKYGTIYELKEKEMEYVEIYEASATEEFEVIEEELKNTLDIRTLDWTAIDKEKESTVYDDFMNGDFSAIEGLWKNGYDNEGSLVRIEGNEFSYQDGSRLIIGFTKEYSDEASSSFNLMEETGVGGAGLFFYPENSEIEFMDEFVPSDSKKKRFFITQADIPEEKDIYYKISDLED